MYHRILRDDDEAKLSIQPGMYVTESAFKKQIKYLKKHYKIISLKKLIDLWNNGADYENKRYCVITFDDGWRDNYLNAYPVLKKYNVPATIFLATSYIGTSNWFWPEKISYLLLNKYSETISALEHISHFKNGLQDISETISKIIRNRNNKGTNEQIDSIIERIKQYPLQVIEDIIDQISQKIGITIPAERLLLDWTEIKEMSNNGISFGSHTCNHKILTTVTRNEAKKELEESLRLLKEKELEFVPVFCYPNGNYNRELQKIVSECGYVAAVTTKTGFEYTSPSDIYGIKRIGVHNDISLTIPLFSFHLSCLRFET